MPKLKSEEVLKAVVSKFELNNLIQEVKLILNYLKQT